MPNHYCFEENFKLLKRSKTIYFFLTESKIFEFGTLWIVWIFWADVSKASFGLYQISLNRWQQLSILFRQKNYILTKTAIRKVYPRTFLGKSQKFSKKAKNAKPKMNFWYRSCQKSVSVKIKTKHWSGKSEIFENLSIKTS